ncbi:MAG: hypothetical protein IJG84_18555 [Kiritimatiellae bacterium]|nr:hypothetical protein [Kiritimatiellia bacterium]
MVLLKSRYRGALSLSGLGMEKEPSSLPGGLVGPSWCGYGDVVGGDGDDGGRRQLPDDGRRVGEPELWYNMAVEPVECR